MEGSIDNLNESLIWNKIASGLFRGITGNPMADAIVMLYAIRLTSNLASYVTFENIKSVYKYITKSWRTKVVNREVIYTYTFEYRQNNMSSGCCGRGSDGVFSNWANSVFISTLLKMIHEQYDGKGTINDLNIKINDDETPNVYVTPHERYAVQYGGEMMFVQVEKKEHEEKKNGGASYGYQFIIETPLPSNKFCALLQKEVIKFLDDKAVDDSLRYYMIKKDRYNDNSNPEVSEFKFVPNRTFKDIYLPEKQYIINSIDKLKDGSLDKITMLLHGKPGCGKTSLIKAIAEYSHRDIVYCKLSYVNNMEMLLSILFGTNLQTERRRSDNKKSHPHERIVIFEDFDTEKADVGDREAKKRRAKKKGKLMENFTKSISKALTGEDPDEEKPKADKDASTDVKNKEETDKADKTDKKSNDTTPGISIEMLDKIAKKESDSDSDEENKTKDDPESDAESEPEKSPKDQKMIDEDDEDYIDEGFVPDLTLGDILNSLDGIITVPGTFVIMTTNHIGGLDQALLRPGRITHNFELKPFNKAQIIEYLSDKYATRDQIDTADAKKQLPDDIELTPAALENLCDRYPPNTIVGEIIQTAKETVKK